MNLTKTPYPGTRDFFPKEKRIRDYLFSIMSQTAESFGYESYDGPILELVDLYKAKSGEELINDQIYSFTDRGERFVAIRPEMTPTLARMVSQVHRETPKPIRWFSIPNVMRYEKPQKGRLREHWQLNCDIFGAPGRSGELEILQVCVELMQRFGANEKHFEILINDRHIVDCVFTDLIQCTKEQSYKLYKIVDRAKKVTPEALDKMINELSIDESRIQILKSYLNLKTFPEVLSFLNANGKTEIAEEFSKLTAQINNLNLTEYLKYDPSIVRGLDYYTGIVFEIFDKNPENRRAICGGGAYANLLQIFNEEPLAGVGFGLGDVTLKDFLVTHNLLPDLNQPQYDLFLSFQDPEAHKTVMQLGTALRKQNLKVITHPEEIKFKKVFPLAEKKLCKFVALLGSQELSQNQILIKNMQTQEQKAFSLSDISSVLHFIKGFL